MSNTKGGKKDEERTQKIVKTINDKRKLHGNADRKLEKRRIYETNFKFIEIYKIFGQQ